MRKTFTVVILLAIAFLYACGGVTADRKNPEKLAAQLINALENDDMAFVYNSLGDRIKKVIKKDISDAKQAASLTGTSMKEIGIPDSETKYVRIKVYSMCAPLKEMDKTKIKKAVIKNISSGAETYSGEIETELNNGKKGNGRFLISKDKDSGLWETSYITVCSGQW